MKRKFVRDATYKPKTQTIIQESFGIHERQQYNILRLTIQPTIGLI
jgi:hypothetical protein